MQRSPREGDEAGNDLIDDAELAADQMLDDEGVEEAGAPTPAEVEDEVIDPEGDIGNFARDHSGVEI